MIETTDRPPSPAELLAGSKRAGKPPAAVAMRCGLRKRRIALGLSLREVAAHSGAASYAALSKVERGRDCFVSVALRLAAFFGCAVEDLWAEDAAAKPRRKAKQRPPEERPAAAEPADPA